MTVQEDRAVGIIPFHKKPNGEFVFCVVHEAEGHWGFPKGHKNADESDEQAARRELYEETGVSAVELLPGALFTEHYSFERGGVRYSKEVHYFLGAVHSMTNATSNDFKKEIPEICWLAYQEAKSTLTFPEAKNLLEEVWEYLRKRLE